MSRFGVIGNGNILALFDENGYMRDFYYPFVGSENHIVSSTHRVAFCIDSKVHFLDNIPNTVSNQNANTLKFSTRGVIDDIKFSVNNIIYNEKDILIKKVTLKNNSDHKKEIKVFFNQEFKIKENKYRNTAYYFPPKNCVIHYMGNRVFTASISTVFGGADDYTIGLFDYEGKKGSYLDCYNINLSKNPIEHGPTDSVIAKSFTINPKETKTIYYTLSATKKIKNALSTQDLIEKRTPAHIYKSTVNYWKAWKNQNSTNTSEIDTKIKNLFYKSLFIIKTHCDKKTGGILASGDSEFYIHGKDNYSYVWGRDAYFPTKIFEETGYHNPPVNMAHFFAKTITKDGYINQKFEQNTALGSSWHPYVDKSNTFKLPIQEDETASVIKVVYNHFIKTKDIEFLEYFYNTLVKKPADFMCEYYYVNLSLPKPSYDIWEEKYMVSTYTTCIVIDALFNAAKLSKVLGKRNEYNLYTSRGELFKKGLFEHLYNSNVNSFIKGIYVDSQAQITNYDVIADSSTQFALWYFNILSLSDEKMLKTIEFHNKLIKDDTLVARFENDTYFSEYGNKENPWIICSLWQIQLDIKRASNKQDLFQIEKRIKNIIDFATPSGILSEQIDFNTKKPISYEPLTWSHATFIDTVLMYIEKLNSLK